MIDGLREPPDFSRKVSCDFQTGFLQSHESQISLMMRSHLPTVKAMNTRTAISTITQD